MKVSLDLVSDSEFFFVDSNELIRLLIELAVSTTRIEAHPWAHRAAASTHAEQIEFSDMDLLNQDNQSDSETSKVTSQIETQPKDVAHEDVLVEACSDTTGKFEINSPPFESVRLSKKRKINGDGNDKKVGKI